MASSNDTNQKMHRLMNGVSNYNNGVHHQIKSVDLIISKIINAEGAYYFSYIEFQLLLELKSYLEGIAKAGEIPQYL